MFFLQDFVTNNVLKNSICLKYQFSSHLKKNIYIVYNIDSIYSIDSLRYANIDVFCIKFQIYIDKLKAIHYQMQGRAETFGGAGAQNIKGAHETQLTIGLCTKYHNSNI